MRKIYKTPQLTISSCVTRSLFAVSAVQTISGRMGQNIGSPDSYGIEFEPSGGLTMDGSAMYSKGTSFGYVWDD